MYEKLLEKIDKIKYIKDAMSSKISDNNQKVSFE